LDLVLVKVMLLVKLLKVLLVNQKQKTKFVLGQQQDQGFCCPDRRQVQRC